MVRTRVVIIGAGFAGLNAAKSLKHVPVDILLIDQNNYHTFQPLLYQVATAGLEVSDIAHQVRGIFHGQKNFRFRQGKVTGVDWQTNEVLLESGEAIGFDYLILGAGAVYNDFGTPGVKEHAFYLKTLAEANNLRSHILQQFELASRHPEMIEQGLLNFVIVGGGPTGVEMAGTLMELFKRVLPKDYPEVDITRAKIIMLEAMGNILTSFSPNSSSYALRVLQRRGVDVQLNSIVSRVTATEVTLKDGRSIPTNTLIWAAGVRANPLVDVLGLELERGFRVKVNPDLSLPGKPHVFVLGDMAGAKDSTGNFYPQVATVAIQQGKYVSRAIKARLEGQFPKDFRYFDKGSMAIIGRNAGIAELSKNLGGFKMRGLLGWLGWLFIHLIYLPGQPHRFSTFLNWIHNYLTFDRHVRLITYLTDSPSDPAQPQPELSRIKSEV